MKRSSTVLLAASVIALGGGNAFAQGAPAPAPAAAAPSKILQTGTATKVSDAKSSDDKKDVKDEKGQGKRLGFSAGLSTSFFSGPYNSGTSGRTLTGSYEVGGSYNPSLSLGLSLGASYRLTDHVGTSAGISFSRDFTFCDTCDDEGGYDPSNGGGGSSQIIDTSDLSLGISHGKLYDWQAIGAKVSGGLSLRLPASRDSLVCNPFYGALGASTNVSRPLGAGVGMGIGLGVNKSFFAHPAAPVGNCSPELRDYDGTSTLTGPVMPESYDGERYAPGANASWSFSSNLSISNFHALLALAAPALKKSPVYEKFSTSFSLGISGRLTSPHGSYMLEETVLTGPVDVGSANKELVIVYPISLGMGYQLAERYSLGVSVSNAVPRLLYDPGSYYRAIPYQTSVTLGLSGSY